MEIRIGYELTFDVPRPTSMLLMLYLHPERASTLARSERVTIEPATRVEDFVDWFGNRAARIVADAGPLRIRYDNVKFFGESPLTEMVTPTQHWLWLSYESRY